MIFINSEICKTSDAHKPRLNLIIKINLQRGDNCVALSNLSICYTWNNTKQYYRNNKCKVSGRTWDEEFEMPNGYYFEYIIKKHETITGKPPVEIYISTKFRTELHSKLNLCTILSLWHARLWSYLGVL